MTYSLGLPLHGSSLIVLPPKFPPSSKNKLAHIPLERGGGGYGCILASEEAVEMLVEPTSLNRGEGLIAMSTGLVGGGEGEGKNGRGEKSWWKERMSEHQLLMWLMVIKTPPSLKDSV